MLQSHPADHIPGLALWKFVAVEGYAALFDLDEVGFDELVVEVLEERDETVFKVDIGVAFLGGLHC